MKKRIKEFWGIAPFVIMVICFLVLALVQKVTGDTIRSSFHSLLICLGVVSFGVLLLWWNTRSGGEKPKTTQKRVASVFLFGVAILLGKVFIGYSYQREYIITRNDIKMVAVGNNFLEGYVYYYQYKNPFFYGKELGYEYYEDGGNNPLAQLPKPKPTNWSFDDLDGNVIEREFGGTDMIGDNQGEMALNQKAEMKKLEIKVLENREDELVFSISLDDFVDSYNGFYWADKNERYLLPSTNWQSDIYSSAIHSSHETVYYTFTEDETVWSLPTITVYVPPDNDYIQEITLNFDDHSYTQAMYDLYEEICFYALRVFFPDLNKEQITELYETLNRLAYENMMPNEQGYSSTAIPCALYYREGIGVYPYFAIGESVRLCIIPVTQETIKDFENKGVEIFEIK